MAPVLRFPHFFYYQLMSSLGFLRAFLPSLLALTLGLTSALAWAQAAAPALPALQVSQPQAHLFKSAAREQLEAHAAKRNAKGVYLNTQLAPERSLLWGLKMGLRYFTQSQPDTAPAPGSIHVQALTAAAIAAAPPHTFWRLGHSSVLLKMANGDLWLTDPQFSERASPFSWVGPKRFAPPAISVADLPPLAGVLISHNHYDHLDYESIMALAPKTAVFLLPEGVDQTVLDWGVAPDKVRSFNWWQSVTASRGLSDKMTVTFTPAQHFSARGLGDRNETLWGSWLLDDGQTKVYFSGDGGYAGHFKAIGQEFGPIDIALLENGAYDQAWLYFHMLPEHTVQAAIDLQARWLVPVHNGTFRLARHRWYEPLERSVQLAHARGVSISTPRFGAPMSITQPQAGSLWWREAMALSGQTLPLAAPPTKAVPRQERQTALK